MQVSEWEGSLFRQSHFRDNEQHNPCLSVVFPFYIGDEEPASVLESCP
jgi:hypothetical protein